MEQITAIPNTLYQTIYKTITSQDFQQKTNMVISVSLELYRVMVSSLLLLFVPQNCGGDICSLNDNITQKEPQYKTGFIINYITAAAFALMYIIEIRREEKLIKLLEVNNTISTDNDSVGKRIEIFPEYKKHQLYQVDKHYKYACYFGMTIFVINTIYSWRVVYQRSLGNQTLLNFVTNILFMISKLSNVLVIIHTDQNVFLSAYLNTKVQFNDIDPREIKKIEKIRTSLVPLIETSPKHIEIEMIESGGGFFIVESKPQLFEEHIDIQIGVDELD
jgi:hypothetical protein